MFELESATAKLSSVNLRAECHGDDNVTGADLKVEVNMSNDDLALFHPSLKSMLYHFDPVRADLADEGRMQESGYWPHLRFAKLGAPLKWDTELVGASVSIDYGVKSAIDLDGCKVNAFALEPKEGGTVVVTFRIQANPDEKQIGKLSTLIQSEITISVTPPESDAGLLEAA